MVNELIDWIGMKYEYVKIGKMKPSCGKVHVYLGMKLYFATRGVMKIKMFDHVSLRKGDFKRSGVTGFRESLQDR